MSLRNGGPAFPGITVNDSDVNLVDPFGTLLPPNGQATYSGMTLRDYLAAQAMAGMLNGTWPDNNERPEIARRAYATADAMLAQRAPSKHVALTDAQIDDLCAKHNQTPGLNLTGFARRFARAVLDAAGVAS